MPAAYELIKISDHQQRWPRPLPGAIHIPPALLVVADLRIGVISVGAAFQPRLSDYRFRATSFRGWKATPTKS
jgi:hypothetical protein